MSDYATKINSYLTFKLGDETFGANVSKVLNILEMIKITKVPKSPLFMKGVINLRGSVLPLIDTKVKFDMGETNYTTNTCILVLDIDMGGEAVHVGALVDSVQEVVDIEENKILPAPTIGSKYKSEFIEGIAKINNEFIMLLNMDLIFSANELSLLRESADDLISEEHKD
jgi:purine-binding chemotaxis protein CheW